MRAVYRACRPTTSEALISGRIVELVGADARLKAALVKVGWNNDHDRQRLLRIIIKRIEVAKGVVRVQIDPAAALADEAEGLRPEPQTVEIACNPVRGAGGVQIAMGKESGTLSGRLDPALIKGVVRGYQWRQPIAQWRSGERSRAGPQGRGKLSICRAYGAQAFWLPT